MNSIRFRLYSLVCGCVILAASCTPYPIFYNIHREKAPTEARIPGPVTSIVIGPFSSGKAMYTGSSVLYCYYGSLWMPLVKPEGKILSLAATNEHLYMLVSTGSGSPDNFMLWRSSDPVSGQWETVYMGDAAAYTLQSIYGNEHRLFASCLLKGVTDDRGKYALFYVDSTKSSLTLLNTGTQYLTGVAADGHTAGSSCFFLATAGTGIYRVEYQASGTPLAPGTVVSGMAALNISGIVNLGDMVTSDNNLENTTGSEIAAIARDGSLYSVSASGIDPRGSIYRLSKWSRSLGLWQDPLDSSKRYLLINLDGDYSTYGYGEISLIFNSGQFSLGTNYVTCAKPGSGGSNPYTDSGDYDNSIGKYSINQMMQAPSAIDTRMTLFAATAQNGLWSYKLREDGWQWNMEE
ncbi:MAG: hypothetical protein LBG42_00265 [Treponema sp.]|jgi:hypothetical protein|nr:hypothetical protein [Treponema sp.]